MQAITSVATSSPSVHVAIACPSPLAEMSVHIIPSVARPEFSMVGSCQPMPSSHLIDQTDQLWG